MANPPMDRGVENFGVAMYWLPLGARGRWVRLGGKAYEAVAALLARREPLDIYHSVLEVHAGEGRFVIEMGPAIDGDHDRRGVVAQGAACFPWAAALRILRYEIRCWPEGITAYDFAVDSPLRLTHDAALAARVLELVHEVPTPVWGRDDLGAGEMWTCNSLTSWLLGRADLCDSIRPPVGGRAPGWDAGLTVARRGRTARAGQDRG
ncbi:MAG TPA: hypothetical protein VFT27_06780 [Actinomycetota bacterium]|nr:hypothetical protein [Actinomycetota bacterium]